MSRQHTARMHTGAAPATQRASSASTNPTAIREPQQEEIRRLAYEYWNQRGCPDGCPDEDWFRAESDLMKGVTRG